MNKELKKEYINDWNAKLKAGKKFREKYTESDNWDTFRKQYRGQWNKSILPVNKIFSYGRTLIPRLYFNAPRVSVTATHPNMVAHARVVEAIDNALIREAKLKKYIKKAIVDAFLCGYSPIKLGFDSEFGYIPEQSLDADGSTVTQHSIKEGEKIEYKESIKPGMPWAMTCQPEDIIVPWGSDDINSLPWICHYIIRPLKDVQNDSKYTNTKDLKGTRTPTLNSSKEAFKPSNEKDYGEQFAELYEIRDFRTKEIIVICEDEIILKDNDALQIEGMPYEFLIFNEDPEYCLGISDAHILQPQQRELNGITTQTAIHRSIALIKFLYKRNLLTEPALEALLSGTVGPGIPIDGDEPIASVIQILQPHIPPEMWQAAQATINGMRETVGFSSTEQMGNYSGTPRTATEMMTVSGDIDQRIGERRDIVGDLIENIIRKWNQYIFSFWSEERVVQVVGPEGALEWVTYTGEQLVGEYFLNVDADSGISLTKQTRFQMGNTLFGAFNGDPMIDQIKLRQVLLDSFYQTDPRIPGLLNMPKGMDPAALGAARQPSPAGAGMGSGSGGGRSGSSPDRPQEFNSFKKRFEGAK